MGGFVKGLFVGAMVPGVIAYLSHSQVKDLRAERTKEVAAIGQVVDSMHGMDKSVENLVRGINVLQMGCDYRNGEDPRSVLQTAMKRHVTNYEAERNGVYQTLEGRATDLEVVLGKSNSSRLTDLLADLKKKGVDYANKIF